MATTAALKAGVSKSGDSAKIFLPLVFFSPRSAGDDVDLEDYVNRPEKISAADVAAIAQVST